MVTGELVLDEKVTIRELISQVKPFDLILFRGNDVVSNTISKFEKYFVGNGDWTHVGVAINLNVCPVIKNANTGRMYILESTVSGRLGGGINNVETGKAKLGVQIRDLEYVVSEYIKQPGCKVGWAPLTDESVKLINERTDVVDICTKFHDSYVGRMYDLSVIDLIASVVPPIRVLRTIKEYTYGWLFGSNNWQFCSEVATELYEKLGIIKESFDGRDVAPVDLTGYDKEGLPIFVKLPPKQIIE
jgi:hypothetical protein